MKAMVTGATGFIGSHVVRALLADGHDVRALARPVAPGQRAALPPEVELVQGDILDPDALRRACAGCEAVFHVAALYGLWAPDPTEFYRVNVRGTENVLTAARAAGVRRIVHTSSVATVVPSSMPTGLARAKAATLLPHGRSEDASQGTRNREVTSAVGDESGFAEPDAVHSHYKRSKILAERVALRHAAEGLPVVVVNPSTPIGWGDVKPTPTGKIVLDFLRGRMPAFVDTGMNLVDVEDVAEGHVLAWRKGRIGERYILGNEDVTLREMLSLLALESDRRSPRIRLPFLAALAAGAISETVQGRLLGREPAVPFEGVRMAAHPMFYDPTRSRRELGLSQRPIRTALRKSARWFQEHDYV